MHIMILAGTLSLLLQIEAPSKANEDFLIELEYTIKPRPLASNSNINMVETEKQRKQRSTGGEPLPYLILQLSILKLSGEEVRIRCTNNLGKTVLSKKAELDKKYKLDLGYTDDIKDQVTAHAYTIDFLSADKREVSRILLVVEKDGTFSVNGSKRGKF